MLDAVRGGATLQGARDGALANLVERDRRLAYELAAGVLRRRGQLDRMLELATANPRLHDVLRLGAYQLRALARVPAYAAVSTSVELAREVAGEKAARYVYQALRRLARDALKDSLTVAGCGMRDAVETHPLWLVKRWKVQFGASRTPDPAARSVGRHDAPSPAHEGGFRGTRGTLRRRGRGRNGGDASRIPPPASRAVAGVRGGWLRGAGSRPRARVSLRGVPARGDGLRRLRRSRGQVRCARARWGAAAGRRRTA